MGRLTVAISGARGFVGGRLAEVMAADARVIGLSRNLPSSPFAHVAEWRRCDLFSYEDAYAALEGVDVAYYLVHAMMPSARLTRGRFEDLDVISADNFARAARARGVRQIVYLGGLIPQGVELSRHLASRREVEHVLSAHGVPVTALRAGLVVGRNGSSFSMLFRLVQRLPVMLCPGWMRMRTQPIDLEDVVRLLAFCADRPDTLGKVFDIGGPDVMTYQDMVQATARALGKRRFMLPVRHFSTRLSCLWVSLVTGAPRALVRPLVDSLNHETVAHERTLQERAGVTGRPFADSLAEAVESGPGREQPVAFRGWRGTAEPKARSVQRLRLPAGWDAEGVAREYLAWLVRALPVLRVRRHDALKVSFQLWTWSLPLLLLEFAPHASTSDRALFYVRGGALARGAQSGRLEFLMVPGTQEVLAAVHDFRPRLPWWLYVISHALVHELVMWAFGRHLARLSSGRSHLPQEHPA